MFQFDNDVRELRMIFEGQDHIHQSINAMNRRMNEVMGIAQQLSSQVTNLQNQGGAVQQVTYIHLLLCVWLAITGHSVFEPMFKITMMAWCHIYAVMWHNSTCNFVKCCSPHKASQPHRGGHFCNLVSLYLQGGAPAPPVQQGGNRIPDIQRHEVDHLIRSSNDLTQQINNLK